MYKIESNSEPEALLWNGPKYEALVQMSNLLTKAAVSHEYLCDNEPCLVIPACEGDKNFKIYVDGAYILRFEVEEIEE